MANSSRHHSTIATVAFRTLNLSLSYLIPTAMLVRVGDFVEVPYKKNTKTGIVTRLQPYQPTPYALKPLIRHASALYSLGDAFYAFLNQAALYYCSDPCIAWQMAFSKDYWERALQPTHTSSAYSFSQGTWKKTLENSIKKLKKLASDGNHTSHLDLLYTRINDTNINALIQHGWLQLAPSNCLDFHRYVNHQTISLNPKQRIVCDNIEKNMDGFQSHYVYGVTGSGKTHVYIQLAQHMLQKGKQVLLLVPEISLTGQLLDRLSVAFCPKLMVCMHSGLSDKARDFHWKKIALMHAGLLVGTRSALFTPIPRLGLIIMDEEHDLSYKEQKGLRYHARVVAHIRAKAQGIPLVMASATPSLTCFERIQRKLCTMHRLSSRHSGAAPPQVNVRSIEGKKVAFGGLSESFEDIATCLHDEQKVLVYVNRRGFSPCLWCSHCGQKSMCTSCDKPYTYYETKAMQMCHRCQTSSKPPSHCPQCGNDTLLALGYGTERIQEALRVRFPDVDILQVDRDTCNTHNKLTQTLATIHSKGKQIIICTQLLIKSHHIKNLSLVVFLDADKALHSKDFRTMEHLLQESFQLIGRCGREGSYPAKVTIFTKQPSHPIWGQLIQHDYLAALNAVASTRKACQLPPYSHQVVCHFSSSNATKSLDMATRCYLDLKNQPETLVFPPFESVVFKKQGIYRYAIVAQAAKRISIYAFVARLKHERTRLHIPSHSLTIDFDPIEI